MQHRMVSVLSGQAATGIAYQHSTIPFLLQLKPMISVVGESETLCKLSSRLRMALYKDFQVAPPAYQRYTHVHLNRKSPILGHGDDLTEANLSLSR